MYSVRVTLAWQITIGSSSVALRLCALSQGSVLAVKVFNPDCLDVAGTLSSLNPRLFSSVFSIPMPGLSSISHPTCPHAVSKCSQKKLKIIYHHKRFSGDAAQLTMKQSFYIIKQNSYQCCLQHLHMESGPTQDNE